MAIDIQLPSTYCHPHLVLRVPARLFTRIANSRIAEIASLKETDPGADQELDTLQRADLISIGQSGKSYFVTAKGLKVARDLEQLSKD